MQYDDVLTTPSSLTLVFNGVSPWSHIEKFPVGGGKMKMMLNRVLGTQSCVNCLLSSSFFCSGHRDQIACSLLGVFSKARTAATQSLDSSLCSMLSKLP